MSHHNREIEIKLEVQAGLGEIAELLRRELNVSRSVFDTSTDTYWNLSSDVRGDFIRMRELSKGITQVTVKGKDKGSNLNRIEVELETRTARSTVKNLIMAAHGKSAGQISKAYHVFWLDGEDEHTNVSCYEILGLVPTGITYIEIESTNEIKVLEITAKVQQHLTDCSYHVKEASGSLYEMMIQKP